ncbi:hypothetical protein F5Y18DRAFT_390257 [Xylariaceae sp. FL1019]|nr:hypothetical protein F5Y18DRAFT_390257 [Xylariaceae sp. FL1019]
MYEEESHISQGVLCVLPCRYCTLCLVAICWARLHLSSLLLAIMRLVNSLPFVAVASNATPMLSARASSLQQLFNFTTFVDIENSYLRSETSLLLTTFTNGSLFEINPLAESPEAKLIAQLPGATALTGIAEIGPDKFSVTGGVRGNLMYTDETVYVVDFSKKNCTSGGPTISIAATLPDAVFLNGAASLPAHPETVMLADSNLGALFRVNTSSGAVDKIATDPAFEFPANATTAIGINGLKIVDDYLYFTNTAQAVFGRVRIASTGEIVSDVETLFSSPGVSWDDLLVAADGTAYICQSPGAILRVTPDGLTDYPVNNTQLLGPTSIQLPQDGNLYVTTRGATPLSGQVFTVQL